MKAKQEEEPTGPRLNEDITAAYVRLVTGEGVIFFLILFFSLNVEFILN